ncbi:MAG TPA: SapC family protein, partial [Novosphingobium sp.]|nr:SapC family protein [Novosphingobium sp.]
GVDIDCERIVAAPDGGEGLAPLFSNGQPTELTQEALRFCAALQANQVATRAFCEALVAQDLLVEQQAQGTFPGGKPFNLQGFHIVDAQRVAGLPDSVVTEWHRNGWLTLIDFHLASLGRWQDLLHRQGAVSPQLAETASPAGAAELADA